MPGCQSVAPPFHELKKECKWKTNGLQHFSISYIVYVRPMNQNIHVVYLPNRFPVLVRSSLRAIASASQENAKEYIRH